MNAISRLTADAQTLATLAFNHPDTIDVAECTRLPLYVVIEEFIEYAAEGYSVSGATIVEAQKLLASMIEEALCERQEAATARYNAAINNDTLAELHRHEYYSERLTARDLI